MKVSLCDLWHFCFIKVECHNNMAQQLIGGRVQSLEVGSKNKCFSSSLITWSSTYARLVVVRKKQKKTNVICFFVFAPKAKLTLACRCEAASVPQRAVQSHCCPQNVSVPSKTTSFHQDKAWSSAPPYRPQLFLLVLSHTKRRRAPRHSQGSPLASIAAGFSNGILLVSGLWAAIPDAKLSYLTSVWECVCGGIFFFLLSVCACFCTCICVWAGSVLISLDDYTDTSYLIWRAWWQ